ncbi:MAG: hypothetical protein ACD_79C00327G0001, partial [uncultured bacterium]
CALHGAERAPEPDHSRVDGDWVVDSVRAVIREPRIESRNS